MSSLLGYWVWVHDPVEPAEISVFVVSRWSGEAGERRTGRNIRRSVGSQRDELPHSESPDGYELVVQALTADGVADDVDGC